MCTKQIQIRIYPDGTVRAETKNIKGKKCLKYIAPIETLLRARTVDSNFTSEYYEIEESLKQEIIQDIEVEKVEK